MSKIEKLCDAYDRFARAIATIPDERVQELSVTSAGVREFVSEVLKRTPKPKPSQLAAGLEQGWRETPQLVQRVSIEWRALVSKAWHDATLLAYPEFLAMENERLQKVLARGKIKTEAEFYRVRHEIDVLEGLPKSLAILQRLYVLVDVYEGR
jgi:hypothetical protein